MSESSTPINDTTPADTAATEQEQEQTTESATTEQEQPAPKRTRVKRGSVTYVVNPKTLEVRSYKGNPDFNPASEIAVLNPSGMSQLSTQVLVALYNKIRPEKPITKFRDRAAADKAMWPGLEVLAPKPLPGVAAMPAAKKKTAAKKAPATKTARKTAASNGAGRTSAFSGKTITKLVDENPRREGTFGYKSFALIKNGMTYEDYIAKGGRRQDLAWDVDRKFVKVSGK